MPLAAWIWIPLSWRMLMKSFQPARRSCLKLFAGVPPAAGLLMTGRTDAAPQPPQALQGRDVVQELRVRTFINAAGTFTALSGSVMLPEVQAAMLVAAPKFVRLEDLNDAVSNRLAELLQCEAG